MIYILYTQAYIHIIKCEYSDYMIKENKYQWREKKIVYATYKMKVRCLIFRLGQWSDLRVWHAYLYCYGCERRYKQMIPYLQFHRYPFPEELFMFTLFFIFHTFHIDGRRHFQTKCLSMVPAPVSCEKSSAP